MKDGETYGEKDSGGEDARWALYVAGSVLLLIGLKWIGLADDDEAAANIYILIYIR